jgi:cytochrome P450 family 6
MLDTFDYREKNKVQRNDFVSLLLGLKENFTKTELASEGMLMYAGGFETSSTLMSFTLYEIALNEEIQDRLRDEILSGVEENGGKINYEILNGLKYLDMVVSESLRKYPPIPDQIRQCTKDFKVPGTDLVIEKGFNVQIPTFSIQHDEKYWDEPEKFDPERFNEENVKKIVPFTYLPFGEGPR